MCWICAVPVDITVDTFESTFREPAVVLVFCITTEMCFVHVACARTVAMGEQWRKKWKC